MANLSSFYASLSILSGVYPFHHSDLGKLSAVCSFTFLFLDIDSFADSNPRANGSTTCPREYLNSIEVDGMYYLYTLFDSSSYPEHDHNVSEAPFFFFEAYIVDLLIIQNTPSFPP